MKVILKLDVYRHIISEGVRYWERQTWTGRMPDKENRAEYDPLVLLKEHEDGGEHVLFRLDRERDYGGDEVTYLPVVFHHTDPFLALLPRWGFEMDEEVERTTLP